MACPSQRLGRDRLDKPPPWPLQSGLARAHDRDVVSTGRLLMVVWAAGGNVVPAAGLARALAGRGHEVRVLGPEVLRERFKQAGCEFRCLKRAREPYSMKQEVFDDDLLAWTMYVAGRDLAEDVLEELGRASTNIVVVDAFLSAALAAADKAGVPTVALVHVLYQPSVEGAIASQLDRDGPLVDRTRRHLGLPTLGPKAPVAATLWARSSLVLACTPKVFDYPLVGEYPNRHYVGPIFDADRADWCQPVRPTVLVSFSTTDMRQGEVLQRTLDALGPLDVDVFCTLGGIAVDGLHPPANAIVRTWAAHTEILPRASAVVTHAGLSTVMSSLASGVPLVCIPMGRDQPLNADRVAGLGLGHQIPGGSPAETIRAMVEDVLDDPRYRERAQQMAKIIASYRNGAVAVSQIEALLEETSR